MIKVIVESSVPYIQGVIERYVSPLYLDNVDITREHIGDAQAMIVRSITKCNRVLLENTEVKYIATATAGTDHIDDSYCRQEGIQWDNAPGCNALAVAQYVFASLSLLSFREDIDWQEKTIGIIGVGHVGKHVQRIAEILGLRTLLYDPPRAEKEGSTAFVTLDRIQREADIISLHVPLTEDTRQMIDTDFLSCCKRQPILLNACRGAVCDSLSLIDAKRKGLLSHLIIDCWENEPNISRQLLPFVDIASPHIAGFSADGKHRGARMALLALCQHFGIEVDRESLLKPKELVEPSEVIDLNPYPEREQIQRAFLATLNLQNIDEKLRMGNCEFEYLRKYYDYPREMAAHRISGGSREVREKLAKVGFKLV